MASPYSSFGHFVSSQITRGKSPEDDTQTSSVDSLHAYFRILGAEPGCWQFYKDWFQKLRSSGSGLRSRRDIFAEIVFDANLPFETKRILMLSFIADFEEPKATDTPESQTLGEDEPIINHPPISQPSTGETSKEESGQSFRKFTDLPNELCRKIWQIAAEPRPARFINVLHMVDWDLNDLRTDDGLFTATTHRRILKPWNVRAVSFQAREATKKTAIGQDYLTARITEGWHPGLTPVNHSGSLLPTDILYYGGPRFDLPWHLFANAGFDNDDFDTPEELYSQSLDFQGSTLYHPMALPRVIGSTAIAAACPWECSIILSFPGHWEDTLNDPWDDGLTMKVFAMAKNCPEVKTLYLAYMRRGYLLQQEPCQQDYEAVNTGIKIYYRVGAEAEEALASPHMQKPIPVFVDLYDDQRLAEIMSLSTRSFEPDPGFIPTERACRKQKSTHQWCINCSRKGWENGDREKVELLWLSSYVEELQTVEERRAVLGANGICLNRENAWVKEKLALMPELKPMVLFQLSPKRASGIDDAESDINTDEVYPHLMVSPTVTVIGPDFEDDHSAVGVGVDDSD